MDKESSSRINTLTLIDFPCHERDATRFFQLRKQQEQQETTLCLFLFFPFIHLGLLLSQWGVRWEWCVCPRVEHAWDGREITTHSWRHRRFSLSLWLGSHFPNQILDPIDCSPVIPTFELKMHPIIRRHFPSEEKRERHQNLLYPYLGILTRNRCNHTHDNKSLSLSLSHIQHTSHIHTFHPSYVFFFNRVGLLPTPLAIYTVIF